MISVIRDAIHTTGLVDDIIFFGGTALHRTFLNGRLSEDIDLLVNDRKTTALAIDAALKQRFLDIYGTFSASPSFSETLKDTAYAIFDVAGVKIKIQLLNAKGYPQWPTQMQTVNQRFEIFPSLEMKTPTIDSFVCAKTTAWCDRTRNAPRDLFDLWMMADTGHFSSSSLELYRRLGPTGHPPQIDGFPQPPEEQAWLDSLSHQGRINVTAAQAHSTVVDEWRKLLIL